ncbi:MAG: DEAD/DEAH box helicase [Verrucomicrobia bacterium]|nr:DEAD/DEAH box helicase [Verrucomicrobiota bacterium]
MAYNPTRALELLRLGAQSRTAAFREGQDDAICHVVDGKGRLLVVQKTGWGKSFVYFIATKLLREQGSGPVLLISPLLALMRNQIAAATRMAVRAFTINSENQDEWNTVEAALRRNEVDILLIAPERLANEHFRSEVLAPIAGRISLLVVDEAHCISDWGHDFRPHYRFIERIVRTLPPNLRILATTATANNRVLNALHSATGGMSINELLNHVNIRRGRIDKALQLMSLESPAPVVKQDSKWRLTAANLGESFWERAERLTALRRAEQKQMQEYVALTSGHMEFLIRALDGNPGPHRLPDIAPLPITFDAGLAQEAVDFLRRTSLPLEPRRMWPTGGLPHTGVSGRIEAKHQAQRGRVLCVWGDAGWGSLVCQGKSRDGHFADQLVEACAAMVRTWSPKPAPSWVTCIPSRRHPNLAPDFARRLAGALNLPFHPVLEKTDDRPAQKEMANSSQQARNVDGSLKVQATVPTGPVLLVDDMVDSRWTLTVAAYLLITHGSGPVFPLALASTANADE